MKKVLIALVTVICWALPALASDHMNLEENLPTELEDAYPVAYLGREFQGVIRFVDEREGTRMVYQPIVEVGVWRNLQWNLLGTFYSGSADRTGSGDVSSSLLYNFNTESLLVPATAVAVKADFPSGEHSAGVDVTTKLIFSKMPVVRTTFLHRVHLNLVWKRNAGIHEDEERKDQFKGIVGFSCRAGKDNGLVIDYVREQKAKKGEDANLVEVGLRRQLTPFTLVTAGAGAGFGDDSERYRLTLGFQHSF